MKSFLSKIIWVLLFSYFIQGNFDIEIFGLIALIANAFALVTLLVWTWRLWTGDLEYIIPNEIYI